MQNVKHHLRIKFSPNDDLSTLHFTTKIQPFPSPSSSLPYHYPKSTNSLVKANTVNHLSQYQLIDYSELLKYS